MPIITGHEHLGDLRVIDLIAKTSKTGIRDVIRVLIAANMVGQHFDMTLPEMVESSANVMGQRPSPENVAACEQAFADIQRDGSPVALATLELFK